MKKTIYILSVLVLLFSCKTEEESAEIINEYLLNPTEDILKNIKLSDVNGIPKEYYESYYKEDFESGANGWEVKKYKKEHYSVNDGHYFLYHKDKDYVSWVTMDSNFPTRKLQSIENFEIKIRYKYVSRYDDETNKQSEFGGFIGKPANSLDCMYFTILIKPNGDMYSRIGDHYAKSWNKWDSSIIKNVNFDYQTQQGEYNEIVMRKVGKNFYYFVNGVLSNMAQRDSFDLKGRFFGFLISYLDVAIDDIEIKLIKLN